MALLAPHAMAQHMTTGNVKQNATCAVAGVQGNVTVNCSAGVPRSTIALIRRIFANRLKDRDVRVNELTAEVNEWKDRYDKLVMRLVEPGVDEGLRRKAEELLKVGKLDEAGQVLDSILDSGEKAVTQTARSHFDRALLFELQFEPLQALPHYEKACFYRPEDPEYCGAYGLLLLNENDYAMAEPVLRQTLNAYRKQAKTDPKVLPWVATTLNNLGILYGRTQQLKQEAEAYSQALRLQRDLAKASPEVFLPYVATTLNNLGVLYSDMGSYKQSAEAYAEALTIERNLAKADPQASRPYVARLLDNLGVLYGKTNAEKEGISAFHEALRIRRQLAATNPKAYLPDVALTLANMGTFYSSFKRQKASADFYMEALQIWRNLAVTNPQAYLPSVATTLFNLGILYKETQQVKASSDSFIEALQIWRSLAVANLQVYVPKVAMVVVNLGALYKDTSQNTDRDKACKEVRATFAGFGIGAPAAFTPEMNELCSISPP